MFMCIIIDKWDQFRAAEGRGGAMIIMSCIALFHAMHTTIRLDSVLRVSLDLREPGIWIEKLRKSMFFGVVWLLSIKNHYLFERQISG